MVSPHTLAYLFGYGIGLFLFSSTPLQNMAPPPPVFAGPARRIKSEYCGVLDLWQVHAAGSRSPPKALSSWRAGLLPNSVIRSKLLTFYCSPDPRNGSFAAGITLLRAALLELICYAPALSPIRRSLKASRRKPAREGVACPPRAAIQWVGLPDGGPRMRREIQARLRSRNKLQRSRKHSGRKAHEPADKCQLIAKQ